MGVCNGVVCVIGGFGSNGRFKKLRVLFIFGGLVVLFGLDELGWLVLLLGRVMVQFVSSSIWVGGGVGVLTVRTTSVVKDGLVNNDDLGFLVGFWEKFTFLLEMEGGVVANGSCDDWASWARGENFPLNALLILSLSFSKVTVDSLSSVGISYACCHFLAFYLVYVGQVTIKMACAITSTFFFILGSLKFNCCIDKTRVSKSSSAN